MPLEIPSPNFEEVHQYLTVISFKDNKIMPCPTETGAEQSENPEKYNKELKKDYPHALPSFLRGYIGSALLAMPYSFSRVGILWGIILALVCCVSNHYVMKLIVLVCDDCSVSRNAWGKMCKKVSGWQLKLVADVSLLISQVGMCIGETIFALRFLNYAFCKLSITSLCDSHFSHVGMILVFIIPLTAVTNMKHLKIPNEIADYLNILFMMFSILVGFVKFESFGDFATHFDQSFFKVNFADSLFFCGTLLYSVGGVGAILDVRASMTHKSHFYTVLRDGILIVGVNYVLFGAFNYLVSLDETKEIYFYNLPLTRISLLLQILYLFTIPMTYITNQFPILTIVEHWMDPREVHFQADTTEGDPIMKLKRYFVRYLIVAVTITVAYLTPSFELFLSLVGSFNFAVMNGLIPVIAYNIRFKGRVPSWKLGLNLVIMVVTVIVGFFGIVQSINDMMKIQGGAGSLIKV